MEPGTTWSRVRPGRPPASAREGGGAAVVQLDWAAEPVEALRDDLEPPQAAVASGAERWLLRACCGQGKVAPGPKAKGGQHTGLWHWLGALGLFATSKVLFGIVQVVAYMPTVYGVELPPSYASVWAKIVAVVNILSYVVAAAPWCGLAWSSASTTRAFASPCAFAIKMHV